MADNVELPSGSGGAVIATDDDGTAQHQYVKLEFGADNTQTKVSSANPLPVIAASNSGVDIGDVTVNNGTGAAAVPIQDGGNTITVDGTITANLSATDNAVIDAIQAATEATQTALETAGGLVVNLGANNDVTVTGTVDLGATDNAVLDAIAASAALIDDAVYVDDADWTDGTSKHLLTGGLYQSTPQTVTDGDVAPFNITANGALHVAQQGTVTVDGSGVTQPVSGTVTANLGATDNGVLDAIAASVAAIDTDATTIIGHVDGIETVLGTIDTDTGNIATSVAALDDLVLAEDVAHQSGDKGVMALAVRQSSQSDFGADGDYVPMSIDDDGGLRVSIVAGAGSGGTAAADDADFSAGTTQGTPAMGVYESSPSSVTDGDLGTVGITQTRALRTVVEGPVTVDLGSNNDVTVTGTVDLGATDNAVLDAIAASLAGTLTVTGGGGGTEYTEDAASAANPVGNALMLVREDARAGSLTSADGDNVAARGTNAGELYVKHVDSIPVTNTGTFAVQSTLQAGSAAIGKLAANTGVDIGDVDVTSIVPGSAATNLGKAEDAAHSSGDVGVMALSVRRNTAAATSGTDGDYQPLITDTNGRLHTIEPSQAAILTAVQLIDNNAVAHDGAASAIGVGMIGLEARNTEPTAVSATGDATRALATMLGKQVVMPYSIPASTWNYAAASGGITDTTGVTAKAAAGANIRNYITRVQVINGHATVSTDVQIRDGASGTVLWRGFAQAAGGGVSAVFDPPLRGSANTLVQIANGTTGSATYFNLQGYVALE